jgi:hypothetical protein
MSYPSVDIDEEDDGSQYFRDLDRYDQQKSEQEQTCPDCGHGRRQHTRNGCGEQGCPCPKTYMDLSPRRR